MVIASFDDVRVLVNGIMKGFVKFAIKHRRIPLCVTSEKHMWEILEFIIRRRVHINLRQSISDGDRNHIALVCNDALLAAS